VIRHYVGMVCLTAAAALLAGCGTSARAAAASAPTDQQRSQWALPLDSYMDSPVDIVIGDYAENLLVKQCMAKNGVDWPIPTMDVTSLHSSTTSPSGRTLLTEQIAGRFGYHHEAIYPADVAAQLRTLSARILSAAEQSTLDGCVSTARDTLPRPNTTQLATVLANQALTDATLSPVVTRAAEVWRNCMAPQGISDLPAAPDGTNAGMPTPSQSAAFHLQDPTSGASTGEIAAATADARCRVSSGYSDALYAAEWAAQSTALAKNADALVRERDALEVHRKAAHRVITEQGAK